MVTDGPAVDPAPWPEMLQSDIVLKLFLSTLDAETVLRDLEPSAHLERRIVANYRDERDHPLR